MRGSRAKSARRGRSPDAETSSEAVADPSTTDPETSGPALERQPPDPTWSQPMQVGSEAMRTTSSIEGSPSACDIRDSVMAREVPAHSKAVRPSGSRPHGSQRGRRPAGERKMSKILEAAVRLYGSGGSSAVTHRAVAEAAGVPLGLTTYYFTDRQDLLYKAMEYAVGTEADRLNEIVDHFDGELTVDASVELMTRMFFDKTIADPLYDLALFEMFLEATRNPAVRNLTRAWSELIARLTDRVLPPTSPTVPRQIAIQIVTTAIDGLMLEEVSNHTLGLAALSDRLRTVIERLM
jgi:DNA-binding transcriptional regulator YbjK